MVFSHISSWVGRFSFRTIFTYVAGAIIGVVSLSGLVALAAWSDPTVAPTGDNPAAPLNVSISEQVKAGNLGVSGNFRMFANSFVDGAADPASTRIYLELNELGPAFRDPTNPYRWRFWTSDNTGGGGFNPNSLEIWEYLESGTPGLVGSRNRPRMRFLKSTPAIGPKEIQVDAAGSINLLGGALRVYEDPANGSKFGSLQFSSPGGNFHIDSNTNQSTYINWWGGSGGVRIGNGASAVGSLYARDMILKAYDGSNCYKVEVNNAGKLSTTLASC